MPQGTGAHSLSQKAAPDLNLLRSRVQAFWKLRQQGRKQEALNYVDPSCRKNFTSRDELKFSSFSLVEMNFLPDSSSVAVKVNARILFQSFAVPLDFPVEETYVFRNGNWYAQVPPTVNPFQGSGNQKSAKGFSPEIMEKMKKDLDQFQLKLDQIQLGELKQGSLKTFSVGYRNSGTLPAFISITKTPPGLSVSSLVVGVNPGKSGTLLFNLDTTHLDGKISDKIVLVVSNNGAEINREIPVEGYVKAPVTFSPPGLVLGPESRCEVTIKNLTQQEIRLNGLNLPDFMTAEWPGGKTIAPDATIAVVVLWDQSKIPPKWAGSDVVLEFARPVDGWEGSRLRVLPEKPR